MKRSWCLLMWGVLLTLICSLSLTPAEAASPTTTPTPPQAQPTVAANAVTTQIGTPISADAATATTQYPKGSSSVPIDIQGSMGNTLSIPDLTNDFTQDNPALLGTLPRLQQAGTALTQYGYQQNVIYNTNPMQYTGKAVLCPTDSKAQSKEAGSFVSGDNDQLKNLYNASLMVGGSLSPGASVPLDQTKTPVSLGTVDCSIPPGTGIQMPAQTPIPVTVIGRFFDLIETFFRELVNNIWSSTSESLTAVPKGKVLGDGDYISIPALTGVKDSDNFSDNLPNASFVTNSQGALTNFIPYGTELPQTGNGQVTQTDTTVNNQQVKFNFDQYQTVVAMDKNVLCAVTQQDDPVRPKDCSLITTASSCDLPKNLTTNESSCGICGDAPLGSLAKEILAAAGSQFHVPASLIYATMLHEGATHDQIAAGLKNNDTVKSWSVPVGCPDYKPMPTCNNDADGSMAPFGFIKVWFYNGSGTAALWTAVQTVDPSRDTPDKVSRCNFLDAAFAAARELSQWAYYTRTPPTCYTSNTGHRYDMTNSIEPTSCSRSQWTDDVAVKSNVGYYVGSVPWCPDGSEPVPSNLDPKSYKIIPGYASQVVGDYHHYWCQ